MEVSDYSPVDVGLLADQGTCFFALISKLAFRRISVQILIIFSACHVAVTIATSLVNYLGT